MEIEKEKEERERERERERETRERDKKRERSSMTQNDCYTTLQTMNVCNGHHLNVEQAIL